MSFNCVIILYAADAIHVLSFSYKFLWALTPSVMVWMLALLIEDFLSSGSSASELKCSAFLLI